MAWGWQPIISGCPSISCLVESHAHLRLQMRVLRTHQRCAAENVRGSIDVARHIKNNTPFIGNIAYSKREYSYDNYLIELVRHTIEYIKGKNCGRMLLDTIKDEVNQIIQATPEYRAKDRRKRNSNRKRSFRIYVKY